MAVILQFDRFGGPENIVFRDVPLPDPGPGEVRYKVAAFALNRGDLFWLANTYYNVADLPARIGQEACGVVDAVGAGVTRFRVGDRVCSIVQEDGLHCVNGEFAISLERYLLPWPDRLSAEQACSMVSQALTAYYPLVELAPVGPSSTVLVTAGSSTSGNGAIQVAKLLGAKVLTTSRSMDKRDFLLGLGADVVIDSSAEDVGQRMREATDGRGVDLVFDTVAGPMMQRYLHGLAPGAQIYIVGALDGDFDLSGPIIPLVQAGASITGYSIYNYNRDDVLLDRAKAFIVQGMESGALKPIIDRVFPFAESVAAYQYLERGSQRGKVIVSLS